MHMHEFTTCGSAAIFSSSTSANGSSHELAVASQVKYFYIGMSSTVLCIGIDFFKVWWWWICESGDDVASRAEKGLCDRGQLGKWAHCPYWMIVCRRETAWQLATWLPYIVWIVKMSLVYSLDIGWIQKPIFRCNHVLNFLCSPDDMYLDIMFVA